MNSKAIAFAFGFIMMVLPLASAGIIYDEETMDVSTVAGTWTKQWEAMPDSNWTAPPVQFEGQNMYFGQSGVGTDYPRSMAVSDDGKFGAINYGQSGPGSEFNKYQLQAAGQIGDEEGRKPLAMSDDGRYMMAGEMTGAVQPYVYFFSTDTGPIWNLAMGGAVRDIDLTNDGEYGVACGQNTMGASYHSLYMFSRENNSVIWDYDFDSNHCWAASISDDGRYIVAGEYGGATSELIVYDHQQQSIIWQKDMPSNVYDVAISGDGDFFVVGLGAGIVGNEFLKFTTTSSTEDWGYKTSASVHHTQVSYDQTGIAMMDFGGYVYYFTPSSGTPVWTDTSTTNRGQEIGISDDGNVIAAVRQVNGLAVYGPTSATPLMQNSMDGASSGPTGSVDVSGNGKNIIAFDSSARAYIWSDGGNGWSSSDSAPIWSESGMAKDVVISSGGYYGYSDDNDKTLNFGKVPIYSNTYHHDTPIYDDMWTADDYVADYNDITSTDPSLLYLFEEGTGTNAVDSSPNGYTESLAGWWGGTWTWGSGALGGGVYSDNGQIEVNPGPEITGDFTTSIWLRPGVDDANQRGIIQKINFWSAGWTMILQDCKVKVGWGSSTGFDYWSMDSNDLCDGDWHHIALTLDKSETKAYLYEDGVEVDTLTNALFEGDMTATNNLYVGYYGTTNYIGDMDEIALWNTQYMSAAEVANLYALSNDRFESGLVAHWRMEEGTGSTVADLSGNGNTATITGASWDSGYFGNGLDFDQTGDYLVVSDSPELNPAGGITVSHWVNHKGYTGSQTLTVKPNVFVTEIWADNDYGGYFYPGGVQKSIKTTGEPWTETGYGGSFPENEWHHLTLTFDSPTCIGKIYLDGVFIKQEDWSATVADCTTPADPSDMQIARWSGVTQLLNGKMDEIQVWSRALTDEEVMKLYEFQYHGNPVKIDSAQDGKYVVSRTQSGDGGGGIAFFDTTTTPLATADWTATVGAGEYMDMSDNANPIIITGNNDGTVRVFNSTGVEQFNFVAPWDITGVAIEDDNSYAYAGSKDHHVYGWDLTKMDSYMNARHGNPLGYWQFSEGTGTTIADSSGNGYDLTAANDDWVSGKYGNALDFDGLTQKATTSANAFDNIMQRPNTVSMWVYVDDTGEGDNNWLLSKDIWKLRLCPDIGCTGVASTSSHILFNGVGTYRSLDAVITHDQWVHLAMTYQGHGTYGATPTFYVNGVEVEGAWESGSVPSCCNQMSDDDSHDLIVGNHEGSAHTHDGAIDHLMIFPEVLNAEAVNLLYSSATAYQFTYAEWDNWVGGEVLDLASDNGKVAVVTNNKELIMYNSAGVEQWRESTEDIPASVEFANGRVTYTLATTEDYSNDYAGIEDDTDLSYYFKYGRPAALYTMDECQGDVLYDSSGHGLRSETFNAHGGQTSGSNNGKPAWEANGIAGCALHFHSSGTGKGSTVLWEDEYQGPQIAGDSFTISTWMRHGTARSSMDPDFESGDKNNQDTLALAGRHGNGYTPIVGNQKNHNNWNYKCLINPENAETYPDWPDNYYRQESEGWYMISCVRDLVDGEIRLYIDGELVKTVDDDVTPMLRHNSWGDPDHWQLGANQAGYYGTGDMDELVFYTEALDDSEILDMYKRTRQTPLDMSPVAYYPMDFMVQEGDGYAVTGNVEDKSGGGNNGWTYANPTSTQEFAQLDYPSFQSGSIGDSPTNGWTENDPAICNWQRDNTHYKWSAGALGVDCINQQPAGGTTTYSHTNPITIPANTDYTISGWVYADLLGADADGAGGNGYATYISLHDDIGITPTAYSGCNLGKDVVGEKLIDIPSEWAKWHYLECTGNSGASTSLILTLKIQDLKCDAICVWFDQIQMEVGPRMTQGVFGNALTFDGVGDHIKLNNPILPTSEQTISLWIKPETYGWDAFIGGTINNRAYFYSSSTVLAIGTSGGTGWTYVPVTPSLTWHHLVITHNNGEACAYINGKLTGCAATSGDLPAIEYLGQDGPGNEYFDGSLDEVAIFDRVLSTDEIKTLGTPAQSRLSAGLVGFYPFNGNPNDYSDPCCGNGNDATLVNGAQYTQPNLAGHEWGRINHAVTLDGVDDYVDVCDDGEAGCEPSGTSGTIAAWVYVSGDQFPTSGTNPFVSYYTSTTDGVQLKHYSNFGQQKIQLFFEHNPDQDFVECNHASSDCNWRDGDWNHIVGTWDTHKLMRLYVNGMEVGGTGSYWDISPCETACGYGDLTFGSEFYITDNPFLTDTGQTLDMDEVGIWDRPLGIGEITQLYGSRMHEGFNQAGFSVYTSTGERIIHDGWGTSSRYTGIAVAEDGTTALIDDNDLDSVSGDEVKWYDNTLGTAAHFPKNGDMINLGDITTFDGATKLSIGTWVYRTGYNEHLTALVSKDDSFEAFISSGNFGSDQYLSLNICGELVGFPTVSVPVNTWTHVGFTWEGNGGSGTDTRKVYMDGILADTQTTGTKTSLCSNGNEASIGARSNGIYTLPGRMSDLRLYDDLLDANEMAQLASQNPFFTGNYITTSTTPDGWWKLTEHFTEGATAVDSSTNGNDGTPIGAEIYYNNMQARYAVFDDTDDYIYSDKTDIYGNDDLQTATLSVWVYVDNTPSLETIVSFGGGWCGSPAANCGGLFLGAHSSAYYADVYTSSLNNDGPQLRDLDDNDGDGDPATGIDEDWRSGCGVSGSSMPSGNNYGEWVHLVLRFDSTGIGYDPTLVGSGITGGYEDSIKSYGNGVLKQTCNTPYAYIHSDLSASPRLVIGSVTGGGQPMDGQIADVRVFDTAISEADITALASLNPAVTGRYAETSATPVAWIKLNGNDADSSSNKLEMYEQGGLVYQHPSGSISNDAGENINNENALGFGRDGSTLLGGAGNNFYYYDSLGNGWQSSDGQPSWLLTELKSVTAVNADGATTSWGTADGNTNFKSPGLHPVSANLITFWNMGSVQARPIYTITADRISNNGTWWAGEMAVGLDGSLYFESIYDMDGGKQGYIFYKYNITGSKVWEVKTDTYGWFMKSDFSSDSRSSMDVATNGSVIIALNDGFAYISEDGTPTFLDADYPNFQSGVVGPGQCMFMGDTGEIAFASRASGSVNEYFVYNIETKTLKWQFNSEVTAFQIDASNNGNYIIFTNGTQMLFKSADANTLFTKAIADVKASSVANNGYVGLASSTQGWFIYDQDGKTVLSGTGEEGDRYYDIDMDLEGLWFAVAGYNVKTGSAFMEIWSLDDEEYNYPKFTRALREEKTDDDGDLRSYRVKMGEGSVTVLWGWSGSSEAGAMEYKLIKSITLIQIVEKNIKMGLSTALVLLLLLVMLKFFKDFTGKVMGKWKV